MEVFKIDANLNLTGNALFRMEAFLKATQKAALQVEILQKMLGTFKSTQTGLRNLVTDTDGLTRAMRNLAVASKEAGAGVAGVARRGSRFKGAGLLGMFGGPAAIGAAAAYGGYNILKSSYHAGAEYEKYFTQLSARGFTAAQINDAKNFSQSQHIAGISYNDMAHAFVDALMATADPAKAKFLAPALAQGAAYANSTYGGITGKQQQDLVRFAEYRGGGDAARIKQQLELGFQVMALGGGSIKPSELRQMAKYGGGAVSRLSDSALLGLEPILQMRGGSSTGTALQTLSLQLITGQMSKGRGASLQSLGMFDTGAIQFDKSGRPLGNKFGKFRYADQLQSDPFAFLMQTYLPHLAKQGVTAPGQVEQRIQYDFSRTASALLIAMYENSQKIIRTLGTAGKLQSGSAMYGTFLQTRKGAERAIGKAYEDFLITLDKLTGPRITSGLIRLTSALNLLTRFLNGISQSSGVGSITQVGNNDVLGRSLPGLKNFVMEGLKATFGVSNVDAVASANDKKQPIVVHSIINVDGRKLAYATSASLVQHMPIQDEHGYSGSIIGGMIPTPNVLNGQGGFPR
jgi:hypothetical protein